MFLPSGQGVSRGPPPLDVLPVPHLAQVLQVGSGTISRVCPDVFAGVPEIQQFLENLAVLHRGRGDGITPDEFAGDVRLDVVLVPEGALAVLHGPSRFGVLLASLGFAPFLGWVAFPDLSVLLPAVPLDGDADKRGIHDLSLPGLQPHLAKGFIEPGEEEFYQTRLGQLFPKQPQRLDIGDPVLQGKTAEALIGAAIGGSGIPWRRPTDCTGTEAPES